MNNEVKQHLKRAQIRFILDEDLSNELTEVDVALSTACDPDLQLRNENLVSFQKKLDSHYQYRRLKLRRVVIAAAAILLLSTIVVGAMYGSFLQLMLINSNTHTEITLADTATNDWEDAYIPSVFPDTPNKSSIQITRSQRTLTYQIEKKTLTFYQYRDVTTAGFDTENTEPAKPASIGNLTGWIAEKDGERFLYWEQDGFIFALLGHFSEKEMILTAKSVKQT